MKPPPVFEVARLVSGETDRLRELVSLFGEAFEEPEIYLKSQPDDSYLAALLERSSFIAVVASVDEKIIGGLVAYELPKFEQARSELYIFDLAVSEPFRRSGVATSLIQEVTRIAEGMNAWVVYVQATDGDLPPISLYSKLGKHEKVHHFEIEVPWKHPDP
ncbi:MAG: GNAT family N-acetyltransferase [Verrucomicrobiota bacterium]